MMCGMMILTPTRSLMGVEATFRPFDELLRGDASVFRAKCLFVAIHASVLLAALYKFAQLGILPGLLLVVGLFRVFKALLAVTPADYIRSLTPPVPGPLIGRVLH